MKKENNYNSLYSLLKIFFINKKSELVKHCKTIKIRREDFANVILTAKYDYQSFGFKHLVKYTDIAPEHLKPTNEEINALIENKSDKLEGKAFKFTKKITQIFKDRKYLVGHLFYSPDLNNWHFFYFNQRDISKNKNHWQCGSHIHLMNHLFHNCTAESMWNDFLNGKKMRKNLS